MVLGDFVLYLFVFIMNLFLNTSGTLSFLTLCINSNVWKIFKGEGNNFFSTMRKIPSCICTNPTKQKNITLFTSKSIWIRIFFLKVYKFHPHSMFTKEKKGWKLIPWWRQKVVETFTAVARHSNITIMKVW